MKKQYVISCIDEESRRIVLYVDGKLKRGFTEDKNFVEGMIRGLNMEGWTQAYTKEVIDETEKEISNLADEIKTLQNQLAILQFNLARMKDDMICEK